RPNKGVRVLESISVIFGVMKSSSTFYFSKLLGTCRSAGRGLQAEFQALNLVRRQQMLQEFKILYCGRKIAGHKVRLQASSPDCQIAGLAAEQDVQLLDGTFRLLHCQPCRGEGLAAVRVLRIDGDQSLKNDRSIPVASLEVQGVCALRDQIDIAF